MECAYSCDKVLSPPRVAHEHLGSQVVGFCTSSTVPAPTLFIAILFVPLQLPAMASGTAGRPCELSAVPSLRRLQRTSWASRRRTCTTASSPTYKPDLPRHVAGSRCTASRCPCSCLSMTEIPMPFAGPIRNGPAAYPGADVEPPMWTSPGLCHGGTGTSSLAFEARALDPGFCRTHTCRSGCWTS